jgi:ATP-dependent DNA helicase RecQ
MFYDNSDFNTSLLFIRNIQNEEEKKHNIKMLNIIKKYVTELNICRQQMIDYYFSNGKFSNEIDVAHIHECGNCDNCSRNEDDKIDISNECLTIFSLVNELPYNIGITKLILILKGSRDNKVKREQCNIYFGVLAKKTKEYCTMVIETMISKNILQFSSYDNSSFKIIDVGDTNIYECLPIKCHINKSLKNQTYLSNYNFDKYVNTRKQLANRLHIKPYMIINDRTLHLISTKKPKHIGDLWMIDGITQDFVTKYGSFFLDK